MFSSSYMFVCLTVATRYFNESDANRFHTNSPSDMGYTNFILTFFLAFLIGCCDTGTLKKSKLYRNMYVFKIHTLLK